MAREHSVVNTRNGKQVVIGMDVASSEFHTDDGMYDLDFKVCACVCLVCCTNPWRRDHVAGVSIVISGVGTGGTMLRLLSSCGVGSLVDALIFRACFVSCIQTTMRLYSLIQLHS